MSSSTRKRVNAGISVAVPTYDAVESLANSRPSSPGSAPSTLAESLRSYWELRRGPRRGPTHLLRNLHRMGSRAPTHSLYASSKQVFIRTSASINAAVSRLVSLILKDFVAEWFEKITDDKEFPAQVAAQLCQVTNEMESRCAKIDWVHFALFELPEMVHLHVRDAQQCFARLNTVYVGRETSIEAMFQSMQPHVALTQAADSELVYLRHLSHELLRVFMPPEAQSDEVVHHLLREILACTVLRNVVDALADPSTLNEGIIQAAGKYSKKEYFYNADMSRYITQPMRIDDDNGERNEAADGTAHTSDLHTNAGAATVETMLREAQAMMIDGQSTTSDPQHIQNTRKSSLAGSDGQHESSALADGKVDKPGSEASSANAVSSGDSNGNVGVAERLSSQLSFASRWLISDLFSQARWRGWKNNTLRGLVYLHLIITQAFSRIFTMFSEYTFSLNQLLYPEASHESRHRGAIEPLLGLINAALLLDRYNEWVWAQFLYYIFPLINALAGTAIDRTLVKVVRFLISEQQIALYLTILANNLWKPENGEKFRSGNRPYKTLEQQKVLKDDAEELVAELLPYVATKFFYGLSEQERMVAAQRILEPFENRQLNKHLVYNVIDAIVGKIAPELKEQHQESQQAQQ
ncbi:hypothetical protein IWW42_005483 [Coemansia sp. RSA 1085]|nr:PXA domain-containing protein [Coemansia mojavensis]KAI9479475.1 PXA domain-containing protein [Coemansia mojavensis]KAJ1739591.1 hypothetical protein LPJ68_004558 [Coemansia sp. RSA 1086]KAJ2668079.1 hypothetical protein IWW42_005483 [Coemansia sp. RSA 1085]